MAQIHIPDLLDEPSGFQNVQAYDQKNHNWAELRLGFYGINKAIQDALHNYDVRFNAQIAAAPQPSEVVDARVDVTGKVFPNLKARLDSEQSSSVSYINSDISSSDLTLVGHSYMIMRVLDLTTTSYPWKYTVTSQSGWVPPMAGFCTRRCTDISYREA